ncbi:bifunctional nuclease domain-containing protein [Alkalilimnicola ehrlichii]|uniref:bifunctional nuclease domain-containing protein n=1 Tax=Alkalilimnicola ehrlichii TaxID=351052 RepID=UPI003BA1ADA0
MHNHFRVFRPGYPLVAALILLTLLLSQVGSHARDLLLDEAELVPVELATVGIAQPTGVPVVLLREPESGDVVPIFIGPNEARAILQALSGTTTPRPMTHDLMDDVTTALGGTLERVFVDGLLAGTYMGVMEFRVEGRDDPVRVDSRPSDAIALAARTGATIHVAPEVLQAGDDLRYEPLHDDQVVTAVGVTVVEATGELREALGLPDEPGVLVSDAIGEAADAGISAGAFILEVNGEAPERPMDFLHQVRATPQGEPVEVVWWQDGKRQSASLSTDVPDPRRRPKQPQQGITL